MKKGKAVSLLASMLAVALFAAPGKSVADETAKLLPPPAVPPAITRTEPTKVIVELETKEVKMKIDKDTEYNFWTFGGTVPGPMIRVRVGDTVEFHLKNAKDSKNQHSIDIHAVWGQGGGNPASATLPGGSSAFQFKALNPGVYVYHCATPHIPTHIANGMYGLFVVDPEQPLPAVDREYYVMQGDFYTVGKKGEKGLQAFSKEKAIAEQPDYVVFNGAAGALAANPLKAKAGETVRLYVGNGGPNLDSNFHVIGAIFNRVYKEGSITSAPATDVQTTIIPPGGAAVVDLKLAVPARYILVDHAIFRVFEKGAVGFLDASGDENPEIFKPIKGGGGSGGH